MAFLTPVTQVFPIPGQVTGLLLQDASNVTRSVVYNTSESGGRQYSLMTTATTLQLSTTFGRLCYIHCIGATSSNLALYDSAVGTTINVLFNRAPAANEIIRLQIPLQNGLYAVTSGTASLLITWD